MGAASSVSEPSSQDYPSSRQTKQGNDDRRKKFSKFNTLKKKLIRSRSSFKCQDHGKLLRELMQTWSTQEISALVEEYESLFTLKGLSLETNLARPQVSSLKKDLADLFENSYCSDVALLYDGIQFPVHKAVLSARCPYFKDLLSQCDGQHIHPVVQVDIKTEAISAQIFSTLLCYLYTGEILCPQSGQDNLDILIQLGDEFGTPNVLEQDFKSLLSSAEYADTVLVYPGQNHSDITDDADAITNHTYELPCHKAVLCARSPFFRSLFMGRNSELLSKNSSGMTRLVVEESVIPRQYARILLQCLYTDSVDLSFIVKWSSETRRDTRPETHKLLTTAEIAMEVYEVASFTDFTVLAQGCEDIIAEELSTSTLLQTLEWSSQPHGSVWVHRQAVQFMEAEFVNIAQSDIFPFLPKKYLVQLLKSDFLQACEYDVLMAVIKWGEAQVLRQMGQQDVYQESIGKKSTKRRELDNDALRLELSGVIEHVRIRHLLPIHGDLLESAMLKGLVERGMPLDIGEGSFYPCSPWMRKQGEKGFVRPRLFMPYYEESKVILQEHMAAEMERVRLRMVRMCQTMPDTLYMVSSSSSPKQRRSRRASAQSIPVGGASVPLADQDSTNFQATRDRGKEVNACISNACSQIQRTPAIFLSDDRAASSEIKKRVVREFGLPDVAIEVFDDSPENRRSRQRRNPRGDRPNNVRVGFRREHEELLPVSVPDVTIPSSPTVSLGPRSDSLPDYFHFEPHRLDLIDDDVPGSSS